MPLPFLKGDVFCAAKSADGVGTPSTLLGIQVTEAVQAVGKVIASREALPRQLLPAGGAHKALLVPGLLPVSDPSRGDGLQGRVGELVWSLFGRHLQSHYCHWTMQDPHSENVPFVKHHHEAALQTSQPLVTLATRFHSSVIGPGFPISETGAWGLPSALPRDAGDLRHRAPQWRCHLREQGSSTVEGSGLKTASRRPGFES